MDVAMGNLSLGERHIHHSSQIIVNILVSFLKNWQNVSPFNFPFLILSFIVFNSSFNIWEMRRRTQLFRIKMKLTLVIAFILKVRCMGALSLAISWDDRVPPSPCPPRGCFVAVGQSSSSVPSSRYPPLEKGHGTSETPLLLSTSKPNPSLQDAAWVILRSYYDLQLGHESFFLESRHVLYFMHDCMTLCKLVSVSLFHLFFLRLDNSSSNHLSPKFFVENSPCLKSSP
jgi:hypothetical protein